MIFPDIFLKEWLLRYPGLEILTTHCLKCNDEIQTLKPFITKDYVGLAAFKCPTCGVSHKAYASIPYSQAEIDTWG